MCVTRAITNGITDARNKCDHHRVDITENSLELHSIKPTRSEPGGKKRMSTCSMIGVFFICIAILGLIAIGIAMYIECGLPFTIEPLHMFIDLVFFDSRD